ncbi:DUF4394 domain-containing protein [Streptomyces massasporeus]|uniref:DUF4394 domain-containing protein n=1 Tax=Streptomyces massasporeus TaxID=67324 RepID=UPI003F4D04B7
MSLGKVTGLARDTKLVGIDFRVQNEKLYGVGDKGGIYSVFVNLVVAGQLVAGEAASAGRRPSPRLRATRTRGPGYG